MTARTDAQGKHERVPATVIEIDLDYCSNTFGVSPCTAGRKDSGTAQAGSSNTITLRAGASSVNDFYKNMTVRTTGGTGSGQEGKISVYNGTTKVATISGTFAPAPDGTTTYDVIDRPNGCYNTFSNCQDKPNYVKGTKTLKFCVRGMPLPAGELLRPYLLKSTSTPTQIDAAKGLAMRSKTQFALADEPAMDVLDKYISDRSTPAAGTFWPRLIARNPNAIGRFARVRKGYVVSPWDWNTFQTELYVVESIGGPDAQGSVTLLLSDAIKLLDRRKLPVATDGKLTVDLTTGTSISVGAGKGAQYADPATSGKNEYIRIGDEVIRYTTKSTDTLSWPDATYRAQFGTTQVNHKANDGVQLCRAWIAKLSREVVEDILNEGGLADTYLDLAGLAVEDTDWLSEPARITTCIADPETASDLLADILKDLNMMCWWHPVEQKVKFKVDMPQLSTPVAITDDKAILSKTAAERMNAERLTRVAVDYDLVAATAELKKRTSYRTVQIFIDADAEGPNGYGDVRSDLRQSRWLGSGNNVFAAKVVQRRLLRLRDAPVRLRLHLDPKDEIVLGVLTDITTRRIVDNAGNPATVRYRVVKLVDQGSHFEIEARSNNFGRRYGFICPSGYPDYASATFDQRQRAFIAASSGLMSDGSSAYLIL